MEWAATLAAEPEVSLVCSFKLSNNLSSNYKATTTVTGLVIIMNNFFETNSHFDKVSIIETKCLK